MIDKNIESQLHFILSGVFTNGYFQGQEDKKINTEIIKEATRLIIKLFK